jgi:hypothetical protein
MPDPTPPNGPHGAAQLLAAADLEARVAALERPPALAGWLAVSPSLRTALISAIVTAAIGIIGAGGSWAVATIQAHTPAVETAVPAPTVPDDADAIRAALPDEPAPGPAVEDAPPSEAP